MSRKTLFHVQRAFCLLGLGLGFFAGCDSVQTLSLNGTGDPNDNGKASQPVPTGGQSVQSVQSGPTGGLRLLVTDKPFPVEFLASATVTLTRIDVRQSPQGAFLTIEQGEKTVDLLQLRNGQTELLSDGDVPAGHYDQMRLFVTNGKVTLTDGREFDLKVPGGAQSGIKLNFEFDVPETPEGGEETDTVLLLDVDLSRAFSAVPSGAEDVSQIQSFRFHPSFAMRLINLIEAGHISGVVTDNIGNPLANVQVSVSDGISEVTSTFTEADGSFTAVGLAEGSYELEFTKTGYEAAALFGVPVTASTTTDVGVVMMNPGE